ncbi:MAG: glutamate 5-kinase [Anaerolineales bacterium]
MDSTAYSSIVVKLGTSTLTAGTATISPERMVELVRQVALLHKQGCKVVLVSSGAIAAGRERLAFPRLPKQIPAKQMLSAVGQPRIMALYEQLFDIYKLTVAQVLLTRSDLADRPRYLNSRNTLSALLSQSIIPIINENDTVATEEIRVGDNDNLSALVANLIEADLLVMLTDQPGLFTSDPRADPAAELISDIDSPSIPQTVWDAVGGAAGKLGTGGMFTKLQAADLARRSGTTVVIAAGDEENVLIRLAAGEKLGTRFSALATTLEGRKRYILAGGNHLPGVLVVDVGAARALRKGSSLLPVGVKSVSGAFDCGDTVKVVDSSGSEIARGLVNYSAADLARIAGKQSKEIEVILGSDYADEVIHRNNLVLL